MPIDIDKISAALENVSRAELQAEIDRIHAEVEPLRAERETLHVDAIKLQEKAAVLSARITEIEKPLRALGRLMRIAPGAPENTTATVEPATMRSRAADA